MILNIDIDGKEFVVTKEPEMKLDQTGQPRREKQSQLPIWSTQVVVTDEDGGEIIKINVVADDAPGVQVGDVVEPVALIAKPWATNGRSGVAYEARTLRTVSD